MFRLGRLSIAALRRATLPRHTRARMVCAKRFPSGLPSHHGEVSCPSLASAGRRIRSQASLGPPRRQFRLPSMLGFQPGHAARR